MHLGGFRRELLYSTGKHLGYNVGVTIVDAIFGGGWETENLSSPEGSIFLGAWFSSRIATTRNGKQS